MYTSHNMPVIFPLYYPLHPADDDSKLWRISLGDVYYVVDWLVKLALAARAVGRSRDLPVRGALHVRHSANVYVL